MPATLGSSGTSGSERRRRSIWQRAGAWAFLAVPAVGLFELGLHLVQVRGAVPEASWERARAEVEGMAKPEDLIRFAPRWADPIGRKVFGPLATLEREAAGDVSRFPRAIEVSIRGARSPELVPWREVASRTVDGVTLRTLENPEYQPTLTDLVSALTPDGAEVSVVVPGQGDEGQPCSFVRGPAQTGNLGFGPAVPGERFACSGSFAGVGAIADLDYYARRCIYAPPAGGARLLRIVFRGVKFGAMLHGHHGLYVEAERNKSGPPVTLAFRAGDSHLGKVVHNDGEGWKGFELPTAELQGKSADLIAEISAPSANRRAYCFEGITR